MCLTKGKDWIQMEEDGERNDSSFVVAFDAIDSPQNLLSDFPVGTLFAIYKINDLHVG